MSVTTRAGIAGRRSDGHRGVIGGKARIGGEARIGAKARIGAALGVSLDVEAAGSAVRRGG